MTETPFQFSGSTGEPAGSYEGGETTISPSVISTIARLTTLGVPGVSRMAAAPRIARRVLKRSDSPGVVVDLRDDAIYAEIYIAVLPDQNLRELSRSVQRAVSRAITEMVGLQVGRINVHIEDIDFPVEI